jgi:hypothetical protein
MAKIGELALAGGRWNDRQLASKAWIETSTTPKLKAAGSQFTTHRALYAAKESDPDRLMMSGELIPWPGQGARKLLFNYRAKSVDGKVIAGSGEFNSYPNLSGQRTTPAASSPIGTSQSTAPGA